MIFFRTILFLFFIEYLIEIEHRLFLIFVEISNIKKNSKIPKKL